MKFLRQILEVYIHEFKMIFHDQGIILFIVFLPLAYPVIYSLIYNPEIVRDVKMVVVDHDRSRKSRELVRDLNACQEVNVIGYATDIADGRRAMDSHKCFGILEIPEGFGRKCGRGEPANAVLFSDMSLLLRYRGFLVAATNVASEMGAEIMADDINRIAPLAATVAPGGDPMPVHNVVMGNLESGFDSFVMPGVIVLILQQCLMLALGMAGGAKRENPALTGYVGSVDTRSTIASMIGQTACYLTLIIVPTFYLLHYIPMMFAFPMEGNIFQIFLFILPMILASIFMGLTLQGVVTERENIFVIWVVTSVIFLFLSGLTWPRYAMGPVWTIFSDIVPATWGVQGFIRMNANGASLTQVATDYHWLWILTAGYALLAFLVQKFIVRPALYRPTPALTSERTQQSLHE